MPDLQDAISLLEKGDAREASILLDTMARAMPGYATARVLLARAYEGLGEWDGALGAWREALHIVPNSPVIRRGLERAARKATSRAPIDELPELPSVSVSAPSDLRVESTPEPFEGTVARDAFSFDEGPETIEADPVGGAAQDDLGDGDLLDEPPSMRPSEDRFDVPDVDVPDVDVRDVTPEAALPEEPDLKPAVDHDADHDDAVLDDAAHVDAAPEHAGSDIEEPPSETPALEIPAESMDLAARPEEDLDRLIAELESARIVPRPDLESLPEPELEDDIEDVVSVTLARIYASQEQYEEAARVYDLLAEQQPENAEEFGAKASEMRSKASKE